MKRIKKYRDSKFVESAILGASGLIAITLGGLIVYIAGMILNLEFHR
jgi:hypothetical protein